ncbi:MAG TPA: ribosome recycling factor [Clostridiales bacterium]|nr:MAG: ribosome recycling factor [Clostridiales bacterium GWD2_32_59]HAN10579.1 ribosome recycling factor [Clostridiales bacterium]
MNDNLQQLDSKMKGVIEGLDREFTTVRAGRANPHILDRITIDYYGTPTLLNQVANISVPEAKLIEIKPWESSLLKEIEKAIIVSPDVDLNPTNDGKVIRLRFPDLTEARRKDLVKDVKKRAENSKIAIRNIRRDELEMFKKQQKDNKITEDELKVIEKEVQDLTDKYNRKIEEMTDIKEKEIMTV